MRARNVLTLAMTLALPAAALAQGSGEAKAKSAPKAAASRLVVMPAGDVKWADLDPGAPGVTYIQAPEGKPEFRLGPGSYFMQPGGNYRHTTTCDQASDCVFFVESRGKFDLKPVDGGKAPAK